MKKKYLFIVLIVFLTLGSVTMAQGLELDYPDIPGVGTLTDTTSLPDYVKYIFNFSLIIAGLVAFGALIYGGMRYLTSAGNVSAMNDAKSQIFSGLLGLTVLLSSYIILATVNVELVTFDNIDMSTETILINATQAVGVYLMTNDFDPASEEICSPEKGCLHLLTDLNDLGVYNFDNQAQRIQINNEGDRYSFGAILHEDKNFEGQCRVFLGADIPTIQNIVGHDNQWGTIDDAASITIFRIAQPKPGEKVSFYKEADFGTEYQKENELNYVPDLSKDLRSLKIEGDYLVAVFEESVGGDFTGKCEVFRRSDPDLGDNPIGRCGVSWWNSLWASYTPCASSAWVFPMQ